MLEPQNTQMLFIIFILMTGKNTNYNNLRLMKDLKINSINHYEDRIYESEYFPFSYNG